MLAQIRSFLTVVEEGNLHRAAARLHISQSTLSRQMQVLELKLGGRLLERMATGVRPTTKMLFISCRAMPATILRPAWLFYPWKTRR